MDGFRTEGTWNARSRDRMVPIPSPNKHQLTALPDDTEFVNLIISPMSAVVAGAPSILLNGARMSPEIREAIATHPGDLGIAMTIYVLPEGIVPDQAPDDDDKKAD